MAKFGKSDLFLTLTYIPKWREITENLHDGEQPIHCPDLVITVVKLKLRELLEDITCASYLARW